MGGFLMEVTAQVMAKLVSSFTGKFLAPVFMGNWHAATLREVQKIMLLKRGSLCPGGRARRWPAQVVKGDRLFFPILAIAGMVLYYPENDSWTHRSGL
jgi:hypothetical protein